MPFDDRMSLLSEHPFTFGGAGCRKVGFGAVYHHQRDTKQYIKEHFPYKLVVDNIKVWKIGREANMG